MAHKDDGSVTPIRPRKTVTAAEIRAARITLLRASLDALEELARLTGELQDLHGTSA